MSASTGDAGVKNHGPDGENKINTTKFKLVGTGAPYDGGGIRCSLHGIVYQLNLLMLFLKRGLREKYTFSLAAEVDAADKFDDLVFQYQKTAGKTKYRFLQAKSKQDSSRKITKDDLLNLSGGDYSIYKYFVSYRRIKNDKRKFFKGEYQDFIICTNIDIDESLVDNFHQINCPDPFLKFDKGKCVSSPKRLKLKNGTALYNQLKDILLTKNPDYPQIADKLGAMIATSNVIQIEKLFTENRDWIMKHIFDSEKIKGNKHYFKLKEDFLNPSSEDMKDLNDIFLSKYLEKYFEHRNDEENSKNLEDVRYTERQKLSQTEFQLARSFVKRKEKDDKVSLSKEEIHTFLDKLVLAVNQPTEDEIKNIVQEEIGDYMSLIDSELVTSKLQTCILDWAKTRHGRFINNIDCNDFFTDVENQLASCRQTGLTLTRKDKINKLGCFFEDNEMIRETKHFLEGKKDEQIFVVYYDKPLLTEIKIMQLKQPSKADAFIFSDAKVLLDQLDTHVCPLKAFQSRASDQMFIMFNESFKLNDEVRRMLQRFIDITVNRKEKQILLIIPLILKDTFYNSDILKERKYVHICDKNNTFACLCLKSQEILLKEAKIIFQGSETILGDLYDEEWKNFLSGDVLCQLIHRELLIEFNNKCDQYAEVTKYYINRSLQRRIIISRKIMLNHDDFQITSSSNVKDIRTDKDIILISDCKDDFDQLCQLKQNIHWLKNDYKHDEILWQVSRGSVSKLQNYVRRNDNRFYLNSKTKKIVVKDIADIKDKIVIIASEPGMGKSTVLSHVAARAIKQDERRTENLCVIRVNLQDYCSDFYEWPNRALTTEETIKFIGKTTKLNITHCKVESNTEGEISLRVEKDGNKSTDTLLQAKLLSVLYNRRKLVLLLDGFDEICPKYKDKGVYLLQALQSSRIHKIWVTTRLCSVESDLENSLCTFSYKLIPFSFKEQQCFLLRFRKITLKTIAEVTFLLFFISFLDPMFRNRKINNETLFMAVPQHIMMIGTIFEQHFVNFQDNPQQYLVGLKRFDVTVYDLYNKFVLIKFQKLYQEINFKDPRYSDEYEGKLKNIIIQHGKLALKELFPYEDVPQELVSDEEWESLLESVTSLQEKTGLVAHVKGGRLVFVHRNFAEYFAANLLAEALLLKGTRHQRKYYAARDFLYRFLTGPQQPISIMEFLNYKIVSTSEHATLFNLAIGGNERFPSYMTHKEGKWSAIFDNANCKDALGRTPVHLLFNESFYYADTELIKSSKKLWLSEVDDLFKWTPLHYAIAVHVCKFEYVRKYNIVITKETQSKDMYGLTPLMIAARRGCYFNCVQTYLADLPLNLDATDDKGNTALHYSLARFDVSGDIFATELIKIGADILIPNSEGATALDIILSHKKGDLLKPIWNVFETNKIFKKALLERITPNSDLYEFMSAIECNTNHAQEQ